MLHCTQDFLQAWPSVYFSCNERAAQFTTATLDLHWWTSCLQQPSDAPIQCCFGFFWPPSPPPKLHMKPFIPETKGVVKWFGVHVNSPAFMSQIPLRVTAFISCSSRGLQRERNLFKSAPQARGREKLISFNIMQTSITAGQKIGGLLKDQMDGVLGRGLWGALESVVVGLHR